MQALAAFMFPLAGLVGAIAHFFIMFHNAIHLIPPEPEYSIF